ncbi:MAG: putative membrane protein, partial [Planctomycetota bacterium]
MNELTNKEKDYTKAIWILSVGINLLIGLAYF